jgi:three-Cys-motif partner protein
VKRLNPYGLHFAFLDPYRLEDLPFSVIETFSGMQHIDMLVHVSAQDLQRNFDLYSRSTGGPLDVFAPGWREVVDVRQSQPAIRAAYIQYWASKIQELGLAAAEHAELVTGSSRNQRLYWLVLISRHELARDFWDKIRNVSGQGELPL